MEQGWLLTGERHDYSTNVAIDFVVTGMALRMVSTHITGPSVSVLTLTVQAVDLGLNRNADNWKYEGRDLFSPTEKQIRKQIWWSVCITDKYVDGVPDQINH